MKKKNVCMFGIYDPEYARNRIISLGFKENGYTVVQCRVDPVIGGLKKYWRLYKRYKNLENKDFDFVVVGFPGQTVVWLARILFGKGIIFDAHLSLYDSNVFDRKVYSKYSLGAIKDWFFDWHSCFLSKRILLDTYEHISYFVETFHIPRRRFIRVLVGADDTIFYPRGVHGSTNNQFIVHFHGNFIPLQGIPYIIDAASKLKEEHDIKFVIVGSGKKLFEQMQEKVRSLKLDNIEFIGHIPYHDIPSYVSRSSVCLSIFGDTPKTQRVIPNKAYECVAMGVPVITAETPAIKELFTDKKDMLFCKVADGQDLAEKILFLRNNPVKAEEIASNGYNIFKNTVSPKQIGKRLINELTT